VLIIVHRAESEPGRVGLWFDQHNIPYQMCRLALGHKLPPTLAPYRGVVIFGGPMSVNDEHIPFIRDELDWLPTIMDEGVPILGICLGAQMMARCLGSTIAPRADGKVEVGYAPLHPTDAGQKSGIFDAPMSVFQWHQDGIGLPSDPDVTHLASSPLFPVQAFAYKRHVLGIQFHPEVNRAMWHRWIIRAQDMMKRPGAQDRVTQLNERMVHDQETRIWLDKIMPAWLNKNLLS